MNSRIKIAAVTLTLLCSCASGAKEEEKSFADSYVQVSAKDPRYFQTSDGKTYIPVGCNLAAMSKRSDIEHYISELAARGGNYCRVWLNSALFEVQTTYGEVNEENLENIGILMETARKYGVKVKLCIESFRRIKEGRNKWDVKASYHVSNGGPFNDVEEYIVSERGREEFLRRLQIIKDKVVDDPTVFGWELWNEMNAVDYPEIEEWNVYMLEKVKEMFPNHLVMQSLGSLDREWSFPIYEFICRLPSNEVSQVHRYLDCGARLPVCHEAVDSLCEDAVKVLLSYNLDKPAILAESGAVKPDHAGPSALYPLDKDGIILHDVLFAPFFSGAAGPGHSWHWDHYIEKYGHWDVFKGFSAAIDGIDPAAEHFQPSKIVKDNLSWYILRGESTTLVWVRDRLNRWQDEFEAGIAPRTIMGAAMDVAQLTCGTENAEVCVYDPWKDEWTGLGSVSTVVLPSFSRSTVIRIKY